MSFWRSCDTVATVKVVCFPPAKSFGPTCSLVTYGWMKKSVLWFAECKVKHSFFFSPPFLIEESGFEDMICEL